MEQFGPNSFSPGMKSSVFVPDQLVSGPLQLVTDSGIIAAGAAYNRGTVLGQITASGKLTLCVKTAADGSEKPYAILVDNVDATDNDQNCGVYLMGEFNQNRIIHDNSWTLPGLKAALRPLSIFLRDSIQATIS